MFYSSISRFIVRSICSMLALYMIKAYLTCFDLNIRVQEHCKYVALLEGSEYLKQNGFDARLLFLKTQDAPGMSHLRVGDIGTVDCTKIEIFFKNYPFANTR